MGYTPGRLMFGRELRLPLDLVTGRQLGEELPSTTLKYVATLQRRTEVTRQCVAQNLRVAGQAMALWYQQRSHDASYAVGDKVWLHNPRRKRGLAPKIQSPWEGPFTVLEALLDVTYKIKGGARRRTMVVQSIASEPSLILAYLHGTRMRMRKWRRTTVRKTKHPLPPGRAV